MNLAYLNLHLHRRIRLESVKGLVQIFKKFFTYSLIFRSSDQSNSSSGTCSRNELRALQVPICAALNFNSSDRIQIQTVQKFRIHWASILPHKTELESLEKQANLSYMHLALQMGWIRMKAIDPIERFVKYDIEKYYLLILIRSQFTILFIINYVLSYISFIATWDNDRSISKYQKKRYSFIWDFTVKTYVVSILLIDASTTLQF